MELTKSASIVTSGHVSTDCLVGLSSFLPHNLASDLNKVNRNKCKPMMDSSFR